MEKLIKKLCSALLLAMLMRPGMEALPQKASAKVVESSANDGDTAQSKTLHEFLPPQPAPHIDDLKGPGYEVHVHDYHGDHVYPPVPQVYTDSMVEFLKYLEKSFHFIRVIHHDDAMATDLIDQSWHGWLDYLNQAIPFIDHFKVNVDDIEAPNKKPSMTFWEKTMYWFLKRSDIVEVDDSDGNGDGNKINVHYTTVKFDPIGQLVDKSLRLIKEYSGYDSFMNWAKRFHFEFQKYSAFKHEKLTSDDVKSEEVEDGVHLPEGVISISAYDPVVLGINTVLFLGYHALFWASYLPFSGVENAFADYPDINPDDYDSGDSSDDITPEEDAAGLDDGEGRVDDYEYNDQSQSNNHDYYYYDPEVSSYTNYFRTHFAVNHFPDDAAPPPPPHHHPPPHQAHHPHPPHPHHPHQADSRPIVQVKKK